MSPSSLLAGFQGQLQEEEDRDSCDMPMGTFPGGCTGPACVPDPAGCRRGAQQHRGQRRRRRSLGRARWGLRAQGCGPVPSEPRAPCSALPCPHPHPPLGFRAAERPPGHASWEEGVGWAGKGSRDRIPGAILKVTVSHEPQAIVGKPCLLGYFRNCRWQCPG